MRSVHREGEHSRVHLSLGGQERVLGLYDTPEAAAQAREDELRRLGLHDLARLQAARAGADAQETPRRAPAAAAERAPLTA